METKMSKPKKGNSIVRLFIAAIVCFPFNVLPVMAQEEIQDNKAGASVIYLKKENDAIWFNVYVVNPDGDKLSVAILEENGENLYQWNSKSKKIFQTFKVFLKSNSLNVRILNKKTNNVVGVFEINVTNKMVEEVLVTRL
jgi:hypothetical protein